jgi:hypothetical protein
MQYIDINTGCLNFGLSAHQLSAYRKLSIYKLLRPPQADHSVNLSAFALLSTYD